MPQDKNQPTPGQRLRERHKKDTPPAPPPPQAQEAERSKLRPGIADNPVDDAINMAKEVKDFFVSLGQGVADWVMDPEGQIKALKFLSQPGVRNEAGSMMLDAMTENWKNEKGSFDPAQALTQRPVHSISDLFFLKNMVSKGAKLSGAGRVARVLEEFPTKQLKAGVAKVVEADPKGIFSSMGMGPNAALLRKIHPNEYAAEAIEAVNETNRLSPLRLTAADNAAVWDAIAFGTPEAKAALRTPAAQQMYRVWSELSPAQEAHMLERELLTPSRATLSKAQIAASRMPGGATRANVAEAVSKIRSGEWKPLFISIAAPRGMEDIWEMLGGGPKMLGHWGRLEKRRGIPELGKLDDIQTLMVRQIKAFHSYRMRERFVDRAVEVLGRSGKVHRMRGAGDLPAGYAPLPYELLKRYTNTQRKTVAAMLRAQAKGLDPMSAARTAYSEIISDPALRSDFSGVHLAVPRDAARYIAMEMQLPGPLARLYDKGMGYFKASATIYRPSYWVSVAAGNALMAAAEGLLPDIGRGFKARNMLPPEIRARLQHEHAMPGTGRFERVSSTLGEYSGALDATFLRNPAFMKSAEASRIKLLEDAGRSFFVDGNILNDPQKWAALVAASPEALSEATRGLQNLYEQVGGSIPRIAQKEREYGQLVRRAENLENSLKNVVDVDDPLVREAYLAKAAAVEAENALKAMKAEAVDRMVRAGTLEAQLPELERIAGFADEAIEAGNRVAGSYIRLHPIERTWFRRAIPFYAYSKAMAKFAATLPFVHPGRVFLWNRYSQMVNSMRSDPEFPEWLRDYVAVGHTADGSTAYVRVAGILPWQGATRQGEFGGLPVAEAFNPLVQNPVLKIALELQGGAPTFTKRPWSPGEAMTRLDNGEVYSFENGRFRKVIAQPGVMRSLWYSFPLAQLIDEVFLPYVQTDRGWIGQPDPIRRPDGSIMFPREAVLSMTRGFSTDPTAYSNVAIKTIKGKEEEFRQNERRRIVKIIRSYEKDIRSAPPEKREAMIQILRDMAETLRK